MKTDKKYCFNADEAIQLVSSCPIQSVDSKTEPKAKERIARYKNRTLKSTILYRPIPSEDQIGIGRRSDNLTFCPHFFFLPRPHPTPSPLNSLFREAHPFADIAPHYPLQLSEVGLKYLLFPSLSLSPLFCGR